MRNFFKKIVLFLLVIIVFGIIFYTIAYYQQKNLYKKFDSSFNTNREKLGLQNLESDWIRKDYNWDNWKELGYNNYNDYFFQKYFDIFTTADIPIGVSYEERIIDSVLIRGKYIDFGSNILFWKNKILSETDYYEKYIDSISYEIVTIEYYFEDNNDNKDYFKVNYNFIDKNTFVCGTPRFMQEQEEDRAGIPHQGNITKKQADSILLIWKVKL